MFDRRGAIGQPTLIADDACETTENFLWLSTAQRLYWTDIAPGRLVRYEPKSGRKQQP